MKFGYASTRNASLRHNFHKSFAAARRGKLLGQMQNDQPVIRSSSRSSVSLGGRQIEGTRLDFSLALLAFTLPADNSISMSNPTADVLEHSNSPP